MKTPFTLFRFEAFLTIFLVFSVTSSISQDLDPAAWPNLKGYWKFQNVNNLTQATVGSNLVLKGVHQWVPGPAFGDTAIRIDTGSYYKCTHNMQPNGGGDSVNRYTLMFDFKILNLERWHCFHQTDTTNANDAECFIRPQSSETPGAIGVGYTGYSADTVIPGKWYRLAISVNLGSFYRYYLNGALIHEGDTDEIFIDKRFALTEKILFFADNNFEDDTIDIASIAIFDTCLTAAQIALIGTIEPCIANPPQVNFGPDTVLCWNHTLSLNAGAGFKHYLWSTGDTTQFISIDTAGFGTGPGLVWVEVTDMNDCVGSDTLKVTFVDCTGLENQPTESCAGVFPNPSAGKFTLSLARDATEIKILSSTGQLVKDFGALSPGKYDVDLSEWPAGLYLVIVEMYGQSLVTRLVIR